MKHKGIYLILQLKAKRGLNMEILEIFAILENILKEKRKIAKEIREEMGTV